MNQKKNQSNKKHCKQKHAKRTIKRRKYGLVKHKLLKDYQLSCDEIKNRILEACGFEPKYGVPKVLKDLVPAMMALAISTMTLGVTANSLKEAGVLK